MRNNPVPRILEEGYTFKLKEYLENGFELFQKNSWPFIFYTIVALGLYGTLLLIPVINTVLYGPIFLGATIMAYEYSNNEMPPLSHFLKGFTKALPLFKITLLQTLIFLLCASPALYWNFNFETGSQNEPFESLILFHVYFCTPPFIIGKLIIQLNYFDTHQVPILIGILIYTYLNVSWIFAYKYAWFYNLGPWEAMEASRKIVTKKWFHFFSLILILGLLCVAGYLFFFIGLLAALPIASCTLYAAFADIHRLEEEGADEDDDYSRHLID